MKRMSVVLFLMLCASVAQAQFMPFGMWKTTSAPFNPYSIDSLKIHIIARDLKDTLLKTADTTYVMPNRARWRQPYAPSDIYQLTGSLKPVFVDSGLGFVKFDGTDDYMDAGTFYALTQPATIVLVMRVRVHVGNIGVFASSSNATRCVLFEEKPTGQWRLNAYNGAYTASTTAHPEILTDSVYCIAMVANGASSVLRRNGVSRTLDLGSNAMGGFRLARDYDNLSPAALDLFEVYVYHAALSPTQLSAIESDVKKRYYGL